MNAMNAMNDVKPVVYYLRDASNKPYAAIALAKEKNGDNWVFSRGIAICATEDQFVKKTARNIAIGRLKSAISTKNHSLPMGDRNFLAGSIKSTRNLKYKSEYDTVVNDDEKRMLFKPSERGELNGR
jgi:hypothetical protein